MWHHTQGLPGSAPAGVLKLKDVEVFFKMGSDSPVVEVYDPIYPGGSQVQGLHELQFKSKSSVLLCDKTSWGYITHITHPRYGAHDGPKEWILPRLNLVNQ